MKKLSGDLEDKPGEGRGGMRAGSLVSPLSSPLFDVNCKKKKKKKKKKKQSKGNYTSLTLSPSIGIHYPSMPYS
ncbi:hypothetical protein VN97_g5675 [Penicillium thymicola]|uniref:Uncharacterized protein n=1 Tax=Penicillium thymicola TaxID=293382 RepID=A0AAI9TIC0_PENTH|nr:hypothetical protein VN97_g5675 [Penicillium thymicola]